MKIKVADLYDLSLGLNDLADKELPISISLKIEQNQKKVNEELVSTDKIRQKIINKYKDNDVKVENGTKIKEGKVDVFQKEVQELMDQDVELDLKKIDLKDLGEISIKPRSLTFLNTILKTDSAKK